MIAAQNVTTTATEVVPANVKRTAVLLQNTSDVDIYLKLDGSTTALTTANGFKLGAGVSLHFTTTAPSGFEPVYAIHGDSGNKVLRVQEFTQA